MINTGEQRGPDVTVSRLVDAPGKLEPREKRATWRNPVSHGEAQNTFLLKQVNMMNHEAYGQDDLYHLDE